MTGVQTCALPIFTAQDVGPKVGDVAPDFTLPEGRSAESRVAFVIGKDGKIAKIFRPFREVDATSYTELAAAITTARAATTK